MKTCQQCRGEFDVTADDQVFYKKLNVPEPAWCPICRFKRRAQFRNERMLYPRKCGLCGKSIITMYHPKTPYTVYCHACFDSDKWDGRTFAKPYDAARPFLDQLRELMDVVPRQATYTNHTENSEFTNLAGYNKNCYLLFNSAYNEDAMYSRGLSRCRDVMDAYYCVGDERCYEAINVHQSNGVLYGQNVENCLDSVLMLNTVDCQNCFGCVNLRHKSYHFFNEPMEPDEYRKKVGEIMGSYTKMEEARQRFAKFSLQFPRRQHHNVKSEEVSGDYISNSKNVDFSFEVNTCENCKYAFFSKIMKDSYDTIGHGFDAELLYETVAVGFSQRVVASFGVETSHDLMYCMHVKKSGDCFGCVGIRNAQYCILNTQYSPEEYTKLRTQIEAELRASGEYAQFYNYSFAPFAYNETVAQDYFPLSKEEAVAQGFRWEDDLPAPNGKTTLETSKIPDHIRDVQDGIVKEILSCATCGRNYKITIAEFNFLRDLRIPIPRTCFHCRHIARVAKIGPLQLFTRSCNKCQKSIQTTYRPDSPELVYCEECYQREVV